MEPNQAAEDKIKRLQQGFLSKQALRFGDDAIKANFPYDTMTPEEFVARRSHAIGVFSYAEFQYHDEAVKEWVHKVAELLSDER